MSEKEYPERLFVRWMPEKDGELRPICPGRFLAEEHPDGLVRRGERVEVGIYEFKGMATVVNRTEVFDG